jgi:uncharacterized LabA/DUF88 family protein
MKTIVYVDGFNLYYRALKNTAHKWLDLDALCRLVLPASCNIAAINYYTARVSARVDPSSPKDQNTYLTALQTIPHLKVHYGNFQVTEKFMFLAQPLTFRPTSTTPADPVPTFAKVVKTEEKGSDVNLGVHLVRDAFMGAFEHAVVITNDTDLREPIRIVVQEANLPVTLLSPCAQPAATLSALATHVRHIRSGHLSKAQLADPVTTATGQALAKPPGW